MPEAVPPLLQRKCATTISVVVYWLSQWLMGAVVPDSLVEDFYERQRVKWAEAAWSTTESVQHRTSQIDSILLSATATTAAVSLYSDTGPGSAGTNDKMATWWTAGVPSQEKKTGLQTEFPPLPLMTPTAVRSAVPLMRSATGPRVPRHLQSGGSLPQGEGGGQH